MADVIQFDLVSPERRLVSLPVREVRLPGVEGDLTAMPGHAPVLISLRPGLVSVIDEQGGQTDYAVTGGFAEVNGDSVSLLAERGHPREEITQEIFNEMMTEVQIKKESVERSRGTLGEEAVAAATKLLADMEALGTHIGLDPNQATIPD